MLFSFSFSASASALRLARRIAAAPRVAQRPFSSDAAPPAARVARAAAHAQHLREQNAYANRPRNNALLALGLLGFVYGVYTWTRHRVKDLDVFAEKADELDEVRLVKSELAKKGLKMNELK